MCLTNGVTLPRASFQWGVRCQSTLCLCARARWLLIEAMLNRLKLRIRGSLKGALSITVKLRIRGSLKGA